MNALRRRFLLVGLNLFILAACIPPQGATVTPGITPTTPATRTPEPATLTAPAPTVTISPSPAATLTPTPPSTPIPTDTPTVLVASPTVEPTATPTSAPTTAVPPTPVPPTPCAFTWFVTNPPKECPGQAPIYSQTVAEHFEHGVLLWRETPDFYGSKIYAFFYDNKWPYWNPTNDQWLPGMPESDPTIVPPPGFFQPVRGFGIFWRNAYFGAAGSARDRLGWATDQEFSLGQLPMQCRVSPDRSYGCLVAGPDNRVYDVEPNNAWSLWPGTILP